MAYRSYRSLFLTFIAVLFLPLIAAAQNTVTVSGDVKNVFAANPGDAKVRVCFQLTDGAGQSVADPRVIGAGILIADKNVCVVPSSGHFSTTLYANDKISVNGVTSTTMYTVSYLLSNQYQHGDNFVFLAADVTEDLNTKVGLNVAPVVVPPTGDTTYLRGDLGNIGILANPFAISGGISVAGTSVLNGGTLNGTYGGNPTLSGNVSVGGTLTAERMLHTCDANSYNGATWDAQATNAFADSNCSVVSMANVAPGTSAATLIIPNNKSIIFPCGTWTGGASVSPVIQINNWNTLQGLNRNCTVFSTNNATGSIIAANNAVNWWQASDFTIQSAVLRTAGCGFRVQGGHGVVERVVINPVFDGICPDTASVSGDNVFRDIELTDGTGSPGPGSGAAWHCGIKNGGVSTGTVSGNTYSHVTTPSNLTGFTDAMYCIQDGSDTTLFDSNTQGVANLGGNDSVAVHIEVVNGGSQPTLTTFSGDVFEGGLTKNSVVVDSGINTAFIANTIQSGLRGMLINGGDVIKVIANTFHLNQQEAIRVTANADVDIVGNKFSESSQQTTNTFSDIFFAAGAVRFSVVANSHKDIASSGKVCKDGVEIAAGGSDFYSITGDINNSNCGTAAISDGGTGTHKNICNPGGPCSNGLLIGFSGDLSAARSTTQGIMFFGANTNFLDFGITTGSKFTLSGGTLNIGTTPATVTIGSGAVTTAGTAVGAGACQAQTGITVTGALTTDQAVANINAALPATWQTGIRWLAEIQAGNTCTVILCNPTAGSITPAATSTRCTVTR